LRPLISRTWSPHGRLRKIALSPSAELLTPYIRYNPPSGSYWLMGSSLLDKFFPYRAHTVALRKLRIKSARSQTNHITPGHEDYQQPPARYCASVVSHESLQESSCTSNSQRFVILLPEPDHRRRSNSEKRAFLNTGIRIGNDG